jgi:hypothetical protein
MVLESNGDQVAQVGQGDVDGGVHGLVRRAQGAV